MKYADFEFGQKNLVFWDKDKVELQSFTPEGRETEVRFFRKKNFDKWDKKAKIISRYGFSSFRDPFEIEPWNQILIDEANVYGTSVDKNKEAALKGDIQDWQVMEETKMSVAKMVNLQGWIWVGRSQMVCHPDSLIYGEIDEIWYDSKTDTYYVGDTKTSSSVDKMSYWYQLSIYIEILRKLNPDKKISTFGVIDWVKIKKEKWVYNRSFNEKDWSHWIGKEITKDDPVYRAKWNEKKSIPIEKTNLIVKRDLKENNILNQVIKDMELIKKYSITSVDEFKYNLENNSLFQKENRILQEQYDNIKKYLN